MKHIFVTIKEQTWNKLDLSSFSDVSFKYFSHIITGMILVILMLPPAYAWRPDRKGDMDRILAPIYPSPIQQLTSCTGGRQSGKTRREKITRQEERSKD